jgi:hypothetical protein
MKMHDLIGATNRYTKLRLLGQGAHGKAYLIERVLDKEKFVLRVNSNPETT